MDKVSILFMSFVTRLPRKYISHDRNIMYMSNEAPRKCALCEIALPPESAINICENCLKNADCCVGLENLRE